MVRRGLMLTWAATATIAAYRIVKAGADDFHVSQASGASDKLLGVAELGADATADTVDVVLGGSTEVEYGGVVAFGDFLTSDAEGKAVVAAAGNRIIGTALQAGVAGDIGAVLLSPGKV